mmetsp:Transcript_97528/g.271334  ORF Transcript_97528/g.271334 Transcript_97528/m.271334 type:complete len:237 (-) Transcript_97528:979-1689(-)
MAPPGLAGTTDPERNAPCAGGTRPRPQGSSRRHARSRASWRRAPRRAPSCPEALSSSRQRTCSARRLPGLAASWLVSQSRGRRCAGPRTRVVSRLRVDEPTRRREARPSARGRAAAGAATATLRTLPCSPLHTRRRQRGSAGRYAARSCRQAAGGGASGARKRVPTAAQASRPRRSSRPAPRQRRLWAKAVPCGTFLVTCRGPASPVPARSSRAVRHRLSPPPTAEEGHRVFALSS